MSQVKSKGVMKMASEKRSNKEFLSLLKHIRMLKSQLELIAELQLNEEQSTIVNKAVNELQVTINRYK